MRSLLFIFVGLLMAATLVSLTRGVRPAQSSISSDGRGYAAYLTNLAAQGNWDFDSVQAIENNKYSPDYAADFLLPYQGRMLNKYPPGVALAASPLYFGGLWLEYLTNQHWNYYGWGAQLGFFLSALIWATLGLWFVYQTWLSMRVPPHIAGWLLLVVFVAGSIPVYTFQFPSMAHVYAFACSSAWVYALVHIQRKNMLYLAVLSFSMLVWVRPIDILLLSAIPLVLTGVRLPEFSLRHLLLGSALAFCFALGLLAVSFAQTGHLTLFTYQGEGFYFNRPEIAKVLFSFKRGLFVYAPLYLLVFPMALWVSRKMALLFFAFFALAVWITSSWWNWHYGDGFGMRAWIDFYPVLLLFIARGMLAAPRWVVRLSIVFAASTALYGAVQNYQFMQGIMDPSDMDAEKFLHIAGTLDPKKAGELQATRDIPAFGSLGAPLFSGSLPDAIQTKQEFELTQTIGLKPNQRYYLEVKGWVEEGSPSAADEVKLVCDVTSANGSTVLYKAIPIKRIKKDYKGKSWLLHNTLNLSAPSSASSIKVYFWNSQKQEISLKMITLELRPITHGS